MTPRAGTGALLLCLLAAAPAGASRTDYGFGAATRRNLAARRPAVAAVVSTTVASVETATVAAGAGYSAAETAPAAPRGGEIRIVVLFETIPPEFLAMPLRVVEESAERTVLARRGDAPETFFPDTVVLLHVEDAARGVLMVQAGLADVAPVGDEEYGFLLLSPTGGRLAPSTGRRLLVLRSDAVETPALRALARAAHRRVMARFILGGRGEALGGDDEPLSDADRAALTPLALVVDRPLARLHARLVRRLAYEWEARGLAVSETDAPPPEGPWVRLASIPEAERSEADEALFAVTPQWFVGDRLEGASPAGDGLGTLFGGRGE